MVETGSGRSQPYSLGRLETLIQSEHLSFTLADFCQDQLKHDLGHWSALDKTKCYHESLFSA